MGRSSPDDDEFVEFVNASWQRLAHAAFLLTQDRHDAEDLVQGVLAKMYASWRRVRRHDLHAYARRSLANAYIDAYRRGRVIRIDPADQVGDSDRYAGSGDALTPVLDRQELVRLLATLTERERTIVVLRYYFDASEADVADALSISRGSVKSTASRALAKLRITSAQDMHDAQANQDNHNTREVTP